MVQVFSADPETFTPCIRTLLWVAMGEHPNGLVSYCEFDHKYVPFE